MALWRPPKACSEPLPLFSLPLPPSDEMRDWLLDPLAPPPRWIWGGDDSPVWDRSLSVPSGGEPTASSCAALRASLESLGVSRVIVGHTPQEQINCACSGAVWRCDTGMSRWVVGGPCEALEITPEGGMPAWSKWPGSQPPTRPPTDPEAGPLAYRLPRAVLSGREGRPRLDAKELPRCPPKVADPLTVWPPRRACAGRAARRRRRGRAARRAEADGARLGVRC